MSKPPSNRKKASNSPPSDDTSTANFAEDISIQNIMERTKAPNPYYIGEVCQIIVKDNPDLRGKSGCWGVVSHVGEISCIVTMWDGDYTVRIDHLKPLNYLESECQQMQLISDRITRLRDKWAKISLNSRHLDIE